MGDYMMPQEYWTLVCPRNAFSGSVCNVSPCFIRECLYTANDSFIGSRIDVATADPACGVCAANHNDRSSNEHVW